MPQVIGKHVWSGSSMSGKETLSSNILIQIRALHDVFKDVSDVIHNIHDTSSLISLLPVYNLTLDNAF